MNERFVTISVDDGHPTDLRTRDLLLKYNLRATFYIPAHNPERNVMSRFEIRELAEECEVGAHTYNHVPLTNVSRAVAWKEIKDGKDWLQDLLGLPVGSFCYPRGKFNTRVAALVNQAGFIGARTCLFNVNSFPTDPFRWGVSTHARSHSRFIQVRHAILEHNFAGLWQYLNTFRAETNWVLHFRHAMASVQQRGGIAHLYLHSWEIDYLNQWTELEDVFRSLSEAKTLVPVTNGELYQMWNSRCRVATAIPAEEARRGS